MRVRYIVNDVEEAVDFYVSKLGFGIDDGCRMDGQDVFLDNQEQFGLGKPSRCMTICKSFQVLVFSSGLRNK